MLFDAIVAVIVVALLLTPAGRALYRARTRPHPFHRDMLALRRRLRSGTARGDARIRFLDGIRTRVQHFSRGSARGGAISLELLPAACVAAPFTRAAHWGRLAGMSDWRQAGGAAYTLALLLFVLSTISAVIRGKLAGHRAPWSACCLVFLGLSRTLTFDQSEHGAHRDRAERFLGDFVDFREHRAKRAAGIARTVQFVAFASAAIAKTYDLDQYSRYGTIILSAPAQVGARVCPSVDDSER